MHLQPISRELASDQFRHRVRVTWLTQPHDFLSRGAPDRQASTLIRSLFRRVDGFMPYLVVGLFLGPQWLLSRWTMGGVTLILMSTSVLMEAGLVLRWSRRRYNR